MARLHRPAFTKAKPTGKTDTTRTITVGVHLRRRPGHDPVPTFDDYLNGPPRVRLPEDEFARRFGADVGDVAAVKEHFSQFGFASVTHHMARRRVYLTGTVEQFNNAFQVDLYDYEMPIHSGLTHKFYSHHGQGPYIPDHLGRMIMRLHNLHQQNPMMPHLIRPSPDKVQPPVYPGGGGTVTPAILSQIYKFPASYSGAGQVIAVQFQLGSGPPANQIDMVNGCNYYGITPIPTPIWISADGSLPTAQGAATGWQEENTLDVQMCAYFAPNATIVTLAISNTDDFYTRIAHPDPGDPIFTIGSTSAGFSEDLIITGPADQIEADGSLFDDVYEDCAIQGVTQCNSSGDWGNSAAMPWLTAQGTAPPPIVDCVYPATDPYILGVGGTIIGASSGTFSASNFIEFMLGNAASPGLTGTAASGGGVSIIYPLPSYQLGVAGIPPALHVPPGAFGTAGRGYPEISAMMDTEMYITFDTLTPVGGTSMSCPIVASMLACINNALGWNVGYINPILYSLNGNTSIIRRASPGGPPDNAVYAFDGVSSFVKNSPAYPTSTTAWACSIGLGILQAQPFITYLQSVKNVVTITGITLSNTIIPSAPSGTIVGSVSVQTTGGAFTGAVAVGPDTGETLNAQQWFYMDGNNLIVVEAPTTPGPYSITLVAVQTGSTIFTKSFSITVSAAPPPTTSATSNTFAVNAPVTGLRDWSLNPGGDGSFWVTPFQVGANWITSGPLITALRGGNGGSVNVNPNYSVPWVRGTATDPLVQVSDGTKTIHVHIPLGTITEQPIPSAGNQNIGGSDSTQPYLVWSIDNATINTGSVAASGSVITGNNMCINDGSGAVMMDIVTGESASGNNSLGAAILDYDLTQANANPNYVIQHMLQYQLDPSFQCNTSAPGPIWPLLLIDTSGGAGSGPMPQGYTMGIPASDVRPTGQTRGYYLLYDTFKQMGGFFYNVGAGGGTNIMVYSTNSANTALVNDIVTSWPVVMQRMCLLDATNGTAGSQYSVATIKGMVGGVRNDAFTPPPLLDYTPTGGSVPTAAQIAAFGAWYNTSPVYTTPWTPNVPGKHVLISAIASQTVGVAFTVSGTITGDTTAPTLQYQDNGTSGSWLALPTGATVTTSAFSFTHPAMSANASATVSIRDANTTTVIATSAPFSVSAAGTTVPGPPTNVGTTSITNVSVSVTFSPPTTGGVIDHGGYQIAYKKGSDPTYTNGPFIPVITPGSGSFTDLQSNVHTITAGGQIAVNGVVDGTTSNVIVDLLNGQIESQENSALNWYSKTLPSGGWNAIVQAPLSLPGITITGLAAATLYDFKVSAANSAGTGAFSTVATASTLSSASTGSFTVSGSSILDPNGNPWVSKGVAIWAAGDAIGGGNMTGSFNKIAQLFGSVCNTVRFTCFDPDVAPGGPVSPASKLVSLVNFATNNGAGPFVVVLSYTQTGSVPTGSNLTTVASWFSDIATTFKNNQYVFYELLNEPDPGQGDLSTCYHALAAAVRNAGATAPIIIQPHGGGVISDGSIAKGALDDITNWFVSVHFYANGAAPNSDNTNQTQVNQALATGGFVSFFDGYQTIQNFFNGRATIIGEFGTGGAGGEAQLDTGAAQALIAVESAITSSGRLSGGWFWEVHAAGGVSDSLTPNGGTLSTGASLNGYGQGALSWMTTGTPSGNVSNT